MNVKTSMTIMQQCQNAGATPDSRSDLEFTPSTITCCPSQMITLNTRHEGMVSRDSWQSVSDASAMHMKNAWLSGSRRHRTVQLPIVYKCYPHPHSDPHPSASVFSSPPCPCPCFSKSRGYLLLPLLHRKRPGLSNSSTSPCLSSVSSKEGYRPRGARHGGSVVSEFRTVNIQISKAHLFEFVALPSVKQIHIPMHPALTHRKSEIQ